ncbi:MAG: tRNA lysidine(34) synthetase TilS [Lachnospiraceae bacterium]|nr:tRNA lysidine(34) synthetase TilS [Lachnospiraceae bacterium]
MNRKMEISYQIREQVFRDISEQKLIEHGDTVIAGVSGGADSVCLLFLLSEFQKRVDFSLKVLHVEHGIRGEDAIRDAEFVQELCAKNGIPCSITHVDAADHAKKNHMTLEEAARILRYQAFEQARKAAGSDHVKIAVAHHKEDQAETVLFQLIRGSGLRGLGGMRSRRDSIIRPLLSCDKQDILYYIEENHLPYRTDESNADNRYARNRIRNEIIPALLKMQPGCVDHIAKSAGELQETEEYIEKQTEPLYLKAATEEGGAVVLDLTDFSVYDPVIQKALIRRAVGTCIPAKKDVLRSHIESIRELVEKENGKELHLPKGLRVQKQQNRLIFQKCKESDCFSEEIEGPGLFWEEDETEVSGKAEIAIGAERLLKIRTFSMETGLVIPEDTYTKWFDYDRIKNGLQIRRRRTGDYLCIDDNGHRKSLQDYFVNTKVPAAVRDRLLLVADGDHVVWIPGYRISAAYKITEQTKTIMELKITGGLLWETK